MLRSLAIAFAMYSRIPVPQFDWEERDMRYVMAFFPLVGLVIGLGQMALLMLAGRSALPRFSLEIFLVLLPVLISGAIHLDGFMDASDAFHSYRGREEKVRILKDPHTGAFAVLSLFCLLLLALAASAMLLEGAGRIGNASGAGWIKPGGERAVLSALAAIFWLARILSAFSVLTFPVMPGHGSLAAFSHAADRRRVLGLLTGQLILVSLWILWMGRGVGALVLACAGACFSYYYRRAENAFGGINGDLAGWFVSYSEVAMALAAGLIVFFQ